MACAQAKGLRGNPEAVRQQCGIPLLRPCVLREEQTQAAGVAAPAAPKEEAHSTPPAVISVQPQFVPPPRTIADITAILDSEKPDQARIAERKAAADAVPPAAASPGKLGEFYFNRAEARALLARNKEALADGLQALAVGQKALDVRVLGRIRRLVAQQYRALGDPKSAIAILDAQVREGNVPGRRGSVVNSLTQIAQLEVSMGDLTQANSYASRAEAMVQEARGSPNPNWRAVYPIYGHLWEADADAARGLVFEARGQYSEAEAAYRRAEAFQRAVVKDLPRYSPPVPPAEVFLRSADSYLLAVARNEVKQGKLGEAEADARRALLDVLKLEGKYAPATPDFIIGLAGILVEQGRYQEAEKLARSALDVQRTLGVADSAPQRVSVLSGLGNILVAQRKARAAAEIYAEIDRAVAQWTPQQREVFELNGSRIAALYASGQIEAGIAAAEALVKRQTARTGPNSFDTATARGTLALGYARATRDSDAIREFNAAIPVLLAANKETDDADATLMAARNARLQRVVEAYVGVLAREPAMSKEIAEGTFGLADVVRGHTVQRALADSAARMAAKDAALADLVRKEQDAAKQISAQLGALNNLLSLPSDQRGEQTVGAIKTAIEKLRVERNTAQQQISRQFPAYADLVDPKPPSVAQIKGVLRRGEALLSFYFGQDASFAWAVSKEGATVFAQIPLTAIALEAKVRKLREALEPQAATVDDIPPFDLDLAYELYESLLKPVEAGWQNASSLIVVTNGALGELPLGLLPTRPAHLDLTAKPLFAGYRQVPWLARGYAVTVIPSISALITLRRLPPGSPSRDKLIGFGDPYFKAQDVAEAEAQGDEKIVNVAAANDAGSTVMRGIPLQLRASPHTEDVDAAELAMLPRLPDTREELMAMAKALDVDPTKALYLGKAANERNVEALDLSHYRIVAFATHGLVPGDLDGLTQPALALTAPDIAGVEGNGLLTEDKIFALKLDADWVVLSACNTAAGQGAGAEAASGLGSAFFYAGSRALLVTNWSVHSASARALITDLFRRQAAAPSLPRAEALRQSMMALLDGDGFTGNAGETLFYYAHPLFWAPYSIIGDGGGADAQ
jgi:CHAT domain-containing protein